MKIVFGILATALVVGAGFFVYRDMHLVKQPGSASVSLPTARKLSGKITVTIPAVVKIGATTTITWEDSAGRKDSHYVLYVPVSGAKLLLFDLFRTFSVPGYSFAWNGTVWKAKSPDLREAMKLPPGQYELVVQRSDGLTGTSTAFVVE